MKRLIALVAVCAALVLTAGAEAFDVPFDPTTQYIGACGIVVTPPEPGACDAASGTIQSAFMDAVQMTYYRKWVKDNPGEVARLNATIAAPVCSTPAHPVPQVMRTFFGAMLARLASAYACAEGKDLVLPPLPPLPDPKRTDKTPPTVPGPITLRP